jgi:hypothetical protein
MKMFAYIVIAAAVLAAATMQLIADGATGRAAVRFSFPRLATHLIGSGPAQSMALFAPDSPEDVLAVRARIDELDKSLD